MTDSMRCAFDKLVASRYAAGELNADDEARFERHMKTCVQCGRRVRDQRRLDELIPLLPTYKAPANPPPVERPAAARRAVLLAAAVAAGVMGLMLLRGGDGSLPPLVAEALAADAAVIAAATGSGVGEPAPATVSAQTPWLGFVTCSDRIAPSVRGVYICALRRDAPLARAGARAGDILVAIGRTPIHSDTAMYQRILGKAVGDEIDLTLQRGGERLRYRVQLIPHQLGPRHPFDLDWSPALLEHVDRAEPPGRDLQEIFVSLPDTTASRLGLPPGVLIAVEPDPSLGRETVLGHLQFLFGPGGLQSGDVVTHLYGRSIANRRDLILSLANEPRPSFEMVVNRAGRRITLDFRRHSVQEDSTQEER